jgi:hypothetical protein
MIAFANDAGRTTATIDMAALSRADYSSLDALFHCPISRHLAWDDVLGMFSRLGSANQKSNHEFVFCVGAETHTMRRPHRKELTKSEVLELRHFTARAGCSPATPTGPSDKPSRKAGICHPQEGTPFLKNNSKKLLTRT